VAPGVSIIEAGQKKSFHSFRHTFIDELIKAGVNDKAVSDMVGHEVSKSVTLNRYAKPYSPSALKPEIEKLVFSLNYPIHSWR
jgi:integrase